MAAPETGTSDGGASVSGPANEVPVGPAPVTFPTVVSLPVRGRVDC
ncbi:hypothetical protein [Arthrobacter sp. CDRTa11]|nr:hypothetical protein [Arthrobacter sp. CDRTa11]